MSSSSITRVSVRLNHYFNDHRKLSRILISEDFKNILDLKNHIRKAFGIKGYFYLMCERHYLPQFQDIRIIRDNELIEVIPGQSQSGGFNSTNSNIPRKNFVKKQELLRKKCILKNASNVVITNSSEESSKICKIDENEECPLVDLTKENVEENFNTLKRKRSITPENEENAMEIETTCNEKDYSGTKNPIVILSNEKLVTKMVIPYNGNNTLSLTDTIGVNKLESQNSEHVVLNTCDDLQNASMNREKSKTDDPIKYDPEESEWSYCNETAELSKTKMDSWTEINDSYNGTTDETSNNIQQKRKRSSRSEYKRLSSVGHIISQIAKAQQEDSCKENSCIKTPTTKCDTIENKKSSDSEILGNNTILTRVTLVRSPEVESVTSNVTVRKRVRKRKSKKALKSAEESFSADSCQPSVATMTITTNTAGTPRHTRFSDEDDIVRTIEECSNTSEICDSPMSHSTPHNNLSAILEETTHENVSLDYSQILTEPPKVKTKIIFKILKMTDSYTPVISEYIIAKIQNVSKDKDHVTLKILEGHDELKEPLGIFALEDSENEERIVSTQEMQWSTLIEPKLYRQ